ncbi:MAG: hypothetical protein SOU18_00005, partial [Alloprevotella sp.]|nr:hypothetical protein [Alloprevotella sp.]
LFSWEKGQKNHCFTKHIENFICRSEIPTCFCGFFSGQVGARIDDIESLKVKIHLFSNLHFYHFRDPLRSQPNGDLSQRQGNGPLGRNSWQLRLV